ncbi:YafY family protein [uncultured Enterococcus sp.]|uniref:helix-turn-helix transcriptional regulator n=1 Tax=uncultured Enterococcus sp. TaxID=167972 RepID=UPI002AA8586D|nr:YafY family protein [uncultured Enterococcus sp.]
MRVDRLISIIMILLDKKRIGAKELADKFEVSLRTIYRDIESINMAGIPIRSTSGVGGGFEIMEQYKVDKKVFSTTELSSLLMGLSSLSSMTGGDELVHALAKVKSFIPEEQAKDIDLKANQLSIDLSPWLSNRNMQPYLDRIKTALQESKLLSFEYIDRYGNKTVRKAEPYQLVLKNSHWYWQGYCHERKDFRLFRLSRMSDLQIEEEVFTPREYLKPELDFTEQAAAMQKNIKLRIHHSVIDQVLEYCAYEDFLADGKEHFLVQLPFIENDYYYNILFSFGDKCECLEPVHVREEMRRRIRDIAAIYEN